MANGILQGDPEFIASITGSFAYFLNEPTVAVNLVAGHQYQFFASIQGSCMNGGDSRLYLGDSNFNVLLQNDNAVATGGVTNSTISFTPTTSGKYYLVITEKFSLAGDFTITVINSPASPAYLTA